MNGYTVEADDFSINVNLNTEMELPSNRDTVFHYFEQMKKAFPDLGHFYTRETGDLVLEGDKDSGSYRWLAIEPKRLCAGMINPTSLEHAYELHEMMLELAPHLLTVSVLDCEALDITYGFDFDYQGNHDEIVAEALGLGPGLESLLDIGGSPTILNYEPSLTLALDPTCRMQCRLSFETRTDAYQVRTDDYDDEQISLFFTVRQYWGSGTAGSFVDSFRRQRDIGEKIVREQILPRIVKPLAQAIASRG